MRSATIEAAGLATLEAAGLRRYEVSAFARAGQAARHNVNYWTFGDYLGIGAGAHGKVTFAERDAIIRTSKPLAPARYLGAAPDALRSEAAFSTDARPGEFLLNALRLIDGVELAAVRTTHRAARYRRSTQRGSVCTRAASCSAIGSR